jgi:hypothetical protein
MPSMSYIAQYHAFGLLSLALPYSAQKHVKQLSTICAHGREVLSVNRTAQDHVICLGKAVLSFHTHVERKEQKRIERISKECLKALKADDEEAYMKLIDTAKDTRITHLLKQTDTYLNSLAQAVLSQQTDAPLDAVEEATNEDSFGAHKSFDGILADKMVTLTVLWLLVRANAVARRVLATIQPISLIVFLIEVRGAKGSLPHCCSIVYND